MSDVIVTIRLPPSLLEELRKLSKEQYFVDVSELIRSVLRKKHSGEAGLAGELLGIRKRLREELK